MVKVELRITAREAAASTTVSFEQEAGDFALLKNTQGSIITFLGQRIVISGTRLEWKQQGPSLVCYATMQATLA